ncbi:conserved hypothetical protein [Ricinus communis]|uniref:Protein FAR1-RELATED SEQUENCE n=1 Tax=Ricinus communis TaxID=3988 RepID=B9RVA1_RICCO|nr:conserved hypothetical protein [Ricinus communis]
MDEVSLNTEPVGDNDTDEFEIEGDCAMTECVGQTGVIQGENPLPPAVGMEFDSYEDVYYFYNCYAKDQGFGVRVSNTWYRKSKERYRGKFSCSSAGFKKKSEANKPRPETRTGCPAMIKFRLMENKRWRIIEVEIEHNHLISPASGKFYKSHKLIGAGTKRTLQLDSPDEVQKIRLYRTVIVDAEGNGDVDDDEGKYADLLHSHQLQLKEGDAQAVQDFFCRVQLMDPDFFYVVDRNEQGYMRNLFWADSRSRVAYGYFGDVIVIDTTCLKDKFEVPLQNEIVPSVFEGYLDKDTPLKEFLNKYDQALQTNHQLEALADKDSRNSSSGLKSRCYFELQLSKLYTNEILRRFEKEVEGMYACFSTRQANLDGPLITYIVKEQVEVEGNRQEMRDFEVMYNTSEMDILCVCGLFNFRGYLCRHALSVLNQNGLEEIPPQYILTRWRKDVKRSYVLDHSTGGIDINNAVHRYDQLYKSIVRVVEEGRKSEDHYKITLKGLEEILNKLRFLED